MDEQNPLEEDIIPQHDGDDDDLSPEQFEKVLQFQEVTGVEETAVATSHLSTHKWNVEAAVQNYLSLSDLSSPFADDSGDGEDDFDENPGLRQRRPIPPPDIGNRNGDTPPPARNQVAGPLMTSISWGVQLLAVPIRLVYTSLSSLLMFIYRLILPYSRRLSDPLGDVLKFIQEYEVTHGTEHPGFFQGSYAQALSHAKAELKFLLVYLHSPDHQDTTPFCSTTLSNSSLIQYVNSTMVMWACSVTTTEGYRVSQALRENSYPFLAVIVLRDSRMTVVGRLEGPQQPEPLITKLQSIVRDNEVYLVNARADRTNREQTAALRQEQDQAYLESLRADQEKARRRQLEEEEQKRADKEVEEQEQEVQRQKELLNQNKIDFASRIPQEPEEAPSDNVVQVLVKLPSGKRLTRKFRATESMKYLYYYIFCHPDAPHRFEVTTNFPRSRVPCEPTDEVSEPPTFKEFALPQRTMLFVTDLDA